MSSLKQKIQEMRKAEEQNYATAKAMAKCPEREELLTHSWGRIKAFKWFSQRVDEATKQIREKAFCQKWSDNEPSPCPLKKLQKCLDTGQPCAEALLLVSLKEVLAILGENKNE